MREGKREINEAVGFSTKPYLRRETDNSRAVFSDGGIASVLIRPPRSMRNQSRPWR